MQLRQCIFRDYGKGGMDEMYNPEKDYQCMLDKLNEICKQRKISKYALAKATGISSSSMSNLLNGKSKPYLYNMLLICNALQIPFGELFEKESMSRKNDEWIINAYRMMPSEKRRMLRIYMEMLLRYDGEV